LFYRLVASAGFIQQPPFTGQLFLKAFDELLLLSVLTARIALRVCKTVQGNKEYYKAIFFQAIFFLLKN
jgi:hypothetical protein